MENERVLLDAIALTVRGHETLQSDYLVNLSGSNAPAQAAYREAAEAGRVYLKKLRQLYAEATK